MITYRASRNISRVLLHDRPTLTTPQGGRIVLDSTLFSLWQQADGQSLDDLLAHFHAEGAITDSIRAALACLAEAGLLGREGETAAPVAYAPTNGSLVSIVVVGYNSREWLMECLPSLFAQTWAKLEVIVVDNASSDGTVEWLQVNYPSVRLVTLTASQSFARAVNEGARNAQGEYLLFLNPDVRLELDAIAQMASIAQEDPSCGAVAAKLKFWWAPAFLNGLGNRVGAFSWGTDNGLGYLDLGQFDHWREVPSACFAAALIPRKAWNDIGQVDEGFPMYYEDSEWCYRARLLGYTIRAAPRAVVYHAFGGRIPSGKESGLLPRKLHHVAYGRLRFAVKILGVPFLRRFISNYLLEDLANLLRAVAQRDGDMARAYLGAWLDFWKALPTIKQARRVLQARRVRADNDLFQLQKDMPAPLIWHGLPELTHDNIRSYYLPLIRSGRTRSMPEFKRTDLNPHLLIVSNDVIDAKMAGPGMRYLELARTLSTRLDVTLAVPSETQLEIPRVRMVRYWEERPGSLQVLVENSDVALVSGFMVQKFPFLQLTRTRLVVDLYDPFVLENLHYYMHEPISAQESIHHQAVDIMNRLARLGDFFICGSERQRDFWVGVLAANERINPRTFAHDPSLHALIDVVGIGFPDREPRPNPRLRGIHPAFPVESRIVLWGGGIWDWLDPLTLVRAWPKVLTRHPEARLVFLGTRHPNPRVPTHKMVAQTDALASEIGEKERTIFFYEWIPYEEREGLLCEADIGVTLHPMHIETRYSIRTRILDYLWARLPVLTSDGDVVSEWVQRYGVGRVVPPMDEEAVAEALCQMLDKPKSVWVPAFEPLHASFNWSKVVEPLAQYCLQGNYAPDRLERGAAIAEDAPITWRQLLGRARYIWQTEGLGVFLHRVWRYAQWRLASL